WSSDVCSSDWRHVEARAADVRDEPPVWVLDGQLLLSGRPDADALGEAAIADIKRTLAPAQVAQDVRTGLTFEEVAKLFKDCLQLAFVGRIDRGELSARSAVGVLGVAEQDELQAADELERDT